MRLTRDDFGLLTRPNGLLETIIGVRSEYRYHIERTVTGDVSFLVPVLLSDGTLLPEREMYCSVSNYGKHLSYSWYFTWSGGMQVISFSNSDIYLMCTLYKENVDRNFMCSSSTIPPITELDMLGMDYSDFALLVELNAYIKDISIFMRDF